jgi:hypothetical protein
MSNLDEAQIYAEKRGGKVHIQTGPTTFLFSCHRKHLWERPLEVIIKRYDWCPLCPHSKGERTSRYIFEDLLGKEFPPSRPKFLEGLHLDGYNKELQLAFEFHGQQHFQIVPKHFHPNGQIDLDNQIKRDQKKQDLCKQEGICLISIPYFADIESFIREALIKNGYLQDCSN